jgi:hypothetical protein
VEFCRHDATHSDSDYWIGVHRCGSTRPKDPVTPASQRTGAPICADMGGICIVACMSAVVLVEGDSDKAAIEALAERLGRDLVLEGSSIVSMGGASSIGSFLREALASASPDTTLAGLCDEAEAPQFSLALEAAGLGSDLSVTDMEALGFFVCSRDLEDELIRSLGPVAIEKILTEQGELGKFRTFQNQPQWRNRSLDAQFRRFSGTTSGRKIRYGRVLVEALDLSQIPRPLEAVLAFIDESGSDRARP